MKIRNGFVSNSSSSSFVFLGYKVKETSKVDQDSIEDAELECEFLEGETFYLVGESLGSWGDDDWSIGGITPTELSKLSAEIKEKYQKLHPKKTVGEPELVWGMKVS
jgi:hypothetical protein